MSDIEKIHWTEWKRRYGTPGNGRGGVDINGRINGCFPTEPDYCEDAPEIDTAWLDDEMSIAA